MRLTLITETGKNTISVKFKAGRQRIDDLPPGSFEEFVSRNAWKNAVKAGRIELNGERAWGADHLHEGDRIELLPMKDFSAASYPKIELRVIWEDDHLAAVAKPGGVIVSGNQKRTLKNALPMHLQRSLEPDALSRPDPVHRLDYLTSGVLLAAKTRSSLAALNAAFEARQVDKKYLAVLLGHFSGRLTVDSPVEGRAAESEFCSRDHLHSPVYGPLTLCEMSPHSGRRYQLRIHALEIGHPVLGDIDHGMEGRIFRGRGLFLHALSIEFSHPVTQERMLITCRPPKKFRRFFPELEGVRDGVGVI